MRCEYFDAGLCRSCARMGVPYQRQLREKAARARELLGGHPGIRWLEPAASPEEGFRNKAKMVVSGTASDPVLGILDRSGRGIDLSSCGLYPEPILGALPVLREFIVERRLTPYDVPARRGELKHLLVTVSPGGELMVRFVLRSKKLLVSIRDGLPGLRRALPGLRVASVNILREHAALIEGDEEIVLTEARSLPMRLNGLELSLRPGGFFQTNTEIAARMYRQGAEWIRAEAPAELWDLYCGVGGFALHAARELGADAGAASGPLGPDAGSAARELGSGAGAAAPVPGRDAGAAPRVLGIEVSPEAVASAAQTAERAGMDGVEFRVGDARVLAPEAGAGPEALVVNPPRRGIGPELARWIEASGARTLVYSSCNARSLAEDLRHLPSFAAREGLVLDMFPQTDHFETMLLLRREARSAGPAAVGDAA
ncbi:methyltransferase domain-containing protein [Rothia sp. AR01]|uniref:Methyltransferase domain-containing protein n=1 Tax=Rothia santali TaxID=2949643 RepID=A0A9X2KIR4_9MICC|nr:methyltransferase domain-containing protein [Rothia santali]MCP3426310.1 methyltransferase domain-containing protein [Rothia santali]